MKRKLNARLQSIQLPISQYSIIRSEAAAKQVKENYLPISPFAPFSPDEPLSPFGPAGPLIPWSPFKPGTPCNPDK